MFLWLSSKFHVVNSDTLCALVFDASIPRPSLTLPHSLPLNHRYSYIWPSLSLIQPTEFYRHRLCHGGFYIYWGKRSFIHVVPLSELCDSTKMTNIHPNNPQFCRTTSSVKFKGTRHSAKRASSQLAHSPLTLVLSAQESNAFKEISSIVATSMVASDDHDHLLVSSFALSTFRECWLFVPCLQSELCRALDYPLKCIIQVISFHTDMNNKRLERHSLKRDPNACVPICHQWWRWTMLTLRGIIQREAQIWCTTMYER